MLLFITQTFHMHKMVEISFKIGLIDNIVVFFGIKSWPLTGIFKHKPESSLIFLWFIQQHCHLVTINGAFKKEEFRVLSQYSSSKNVFIAGLWYIKRKTWINTDRKASKTSRHKQYSNNKLKLESWALFIKNHIYHHRQRIKLVRSIFNGTNSFHPSSIRIIKYHFRFGLQRRKIVFLSLSFECVFFECCVTIFWFVAVVGSMKNFI